MMEKMRNKKKKGFTLVELIVVIVIIGILAAIAIPRLSGFTGKASSATVVADAKSIMTAASTIYTDTNAASTPTQAQIEALSGKLKGTITGGTVTISANGDITFTYGLGGKTVTVTNGVMGTVSS